MWKRKLWRVLTTKNKVTKGSGVRCPTHQLRWNAKPGPEPWPGCWRRKKSSGLPRQSLQHGHSHTHPCPTDLRGNRTLTPTPDSEKRNTLPSSWAHLGKKKNPLDFLCTTFRFWTQTPVMNPSRQAHSDAAWPLAVHTHVVLSALSCKKRW